MTQATWSMQPVYAHRAAHPKVTSSDVTAAARDIEAQFSGYGSRTLQCGGGVSVDLLVRSVVRSGRRSRSRQPGNAQAKVCAQVFVANAVFRQTTGRSMGSRIHASLEVEASRELKKGWTAADLETLAFALLGDARIANAIDDGVTMLRLVDTYEWLRVNHPAVLRDLIAAYYAIAPQDTWEPGFWYNYRGNDLRATVDRYWGFTQAWLFARGLTPPAPYDGHAVFAMLAPLARVVAEVATRLVAQQERARNAAELRAILAPAPAASPLSLDVTESLDDVFAI